MATIKCPECKKNVSETLKKCPHCGYKIKAQKKIDISQITSKIKAMNKKKKIICFSVTGAIVGIIIIIIVMLSGVGNMKKTEQDVVRDKIKTTLMIRANLYNDKLFYSSHSVSILTEVQENSYEAAGYVYFNRYGSSKKWETEYTCNCNYYAASDDASCICQLGKSATIVP